MPSVTFTGRTGPAIIVALFFWLISVAVTLIVLYWVIRLAVSAAIRTTQPLPPPQPIPLPVPVRRSTRLDRISDQPPLGPRAGESDPTDG